MKKLLKITALLALLLIVALSVGVWWFLNNINSLARNEIERAGTHSLGVSTRVDSVSIHILRGNLALSGLDIANPSGFKGKHFLALKSGDADVAYRSLREDTIQIPTLTLKGVDANIEQTSAGANYQQILDNIKKNRGSAPPSGPEKKLIIGDLVIENITIHLDVQGMPGSLGQVVNPNTSITLPIERIELKNVGRTGTGVGGTGVTTSELSSIVVQAVMAAAVEKGQGRIPEIILGDIQKRVGAIGDLAQFPVNVIGKAVEDVGKSLGTDLGNLLGGNKDQKKDPPRKP